MKKLKIIPLALLFLILFSSCTSGETEIKNRLIIEGVGVDFDEKSKDYEVTVQAFATSQKGGKDNAASNPVVNYTVKGKTLAEALGDLCDVTGKKTLYSQNLIIVIGNSIKGDEIIKSLDFFAREYTARADVYVAASTGKASDILNINENSSEIPAKIIEESISESYKNSISVDTELYNVINLYLEKTTDFTMPLLEVTKEENGKSSTVKVTGTYIYTKNGEKNHLSADETMFFLMLTDDAKKGNFSVVNDDMTVGLDIIKSSSKIKTYYENGIPEFDITIKCNVDMVEYDAGDFGSFKADDVEKVEAAAGKFIANGVQNLLYRQLKYHKSDIFRFGKRFMQSFPKAYKETEENWEDILPEIKFNIKVKTNLRRIGQETLRQH